MTRMMTAKEIFYVVITIATNNWDLVHILIVVMTLIVSDIESHNHFTVHIRQEDFLYSR